MATARRTFTSKGSSAAAALINHVNLRLSSKYGRITHTHLTHTRLCTHLVPVLLPALVVEGEPQSPAPFLETKQGDDEVHPQGNRYEM